MDALRRATAEQMCEIDGFGEVMAQSVLEFSPRTAPPTFCSVWSATA